MRYSKDHKQQTRQRILEEAKRAFREEGVAGIGLAKLMSNIGLTQGGFYAHFASKDALVAEACADALAETSTRLLDEAAEAAPADALAHVISQYVSAAHRDHPAHGCVLPALSGELARESGEVREALTRELVSYLERLTALLGGDQERAIALLAGMVGGVALARAVSDPVLSERMLAACRRQFIAQFSAASLDQKKAGRSRPS